MHVIEAVRKSRFKMAAAICSQSDVPEGCIISTDVFQALKKNYEFLKSGDDDMGLYETASLVLSKPPSVSVVRVNTLRIDIASAREMLQIHLNRRYQATNIEFVVMQQEILLDVLIISTNCCKKIIEPHAEEVIVDGLCGAAVLRGAHVFTCGVLSTPSGMVAGNALSIYADVNGKCLKGSKLEFKGQKHFVGNGVAVMGRNEIFQENQPRGIAIKVTCQRFLHPSLNELDPEIYFPQNLPSVLVSHNLSPMPGEIILDICAAPGGKATHAGMLMANKGKIIAIDKSKSRVKKMQSVCDKQQLTCIKCLVSDGTKLCTTNGSHPSIDEHPPYRPGSFDKVILDPPCSGIGQRPQLKCQATSSELQSYVAYQRKLFAQAVQLLKPNGRLVYSTCTILVDENENQVAWALRTFKELKLVSQNFHIGEKGILGSELSINDCNLVQRFDPCLLSIMGKDVLTKEKDTIGFFIALFTKS